MEEKLSLANRFGITIGYYKPSRQEYYEIVKELAARENINMPEERLVMAADRWELNHGGISGRTAQQFVNHLVGQNNA